MMIIFLASQRDSIITGIANNVDNRNSSLLIGPSFLKNTWKEIVSLCASNNSIKIMLIGKMLDLRTLDHRKYEFWKACYIAQQKR